MTDKVQKIREVIEKRYEYWREKESNSHSIESEIRMSEYQHLLLMVNSLQEESVSKDFEMALAEMVDKAQKCVVEPLVVAAQWKDYLIELAKSEEPVSEPNKELAETYLAIFNKKFPILPSLKGKQLADYKNFLNKCQQIFGLKEWGIYPIQAKLFKKLSLLWAVWGAEHLQGVGRQDEKEQDIPVSEELEEAAKRYATEGDEISGLYIIDEEVEAFKAGAKWQKENLWKPADGDNLPEIDREVIALLDNGKVVFAHRPPEFWEGKNIVTGKVTRNYPKTYDKGGWNIPDVKYWLDCQIPNMGED